MQTAWGCKLAYIACGIGTSLALMILALYLQRLAYHHLPATDMIVSEQKETSLEFYLYGRF